MPTRDEAWPNGTPCWIDVMVTDPGAARTFYSGLFGWDIQDGPPEAGGYLMCMLNGRPAAAISPKPESNPVPNVWSTYLASDDVEATMAKAQEAGARVMMEPMEVMTAGRIGFALDPTGAPFGVWQAGDHLGIGVYNEPGALVWNEVMTRDYEGAKAFYGAVFGYTFDEMDADFSYASIRRASDGEVVAGVGKLDARVPTDVPPSWGVYFMVEDCDASAARAVELGATLVRDPADTAFGRMVPLIGAQGETFSLVQAPSQPEE